MYSHSSSGLPLTSTVASHGSYTSSSSSSSYPLTHTNMATTMTTSTSTSMIPPYTYTSQPQPSVGFSNFSLTDESASSYIQRLRNGTIQSQTITNTMTTLTSTTTSAITPLLPQIKGENPLPLKQLLCSLWHKDDQQDIHKKALYEAALHVG